MKKSANHYQQAKSLLRKAQSPNGFLAAVNDVATIKGFGRVMVGFVVWQDY